MWFLTVCCFYESIKTWIWPPQERPDVAGNSSSGHVETCGSLGITVRSAYHSQQILGTVRNFVSKIISRVIEKATWGQSLTCTGTYIHLSISTHVNIYRYTTYIHECPQTRIHMKNSEWLLFCPFRTGYHALGLSHSYALCSSSISTSVFTWDQELGIFLFNYLPHPVYWVYIVLQKNILYTTLLISHEAWNSIQ